MSRLALGLLLAAALPAQKHTITLVDGEVLSARLEAVSSAGRVRLAIGDQTRELQLDELESVGCEKPEKRFHKGDALLTLRSGQHLPARLLGGAGQEARFDSPLAGEPLVFALRHLRAIRLGAAQAQDGGYAEAVANPLADRDLIFFSRGDKMQRLSVSVRGLDQGDVLVDYDGNEQRVPLTRLYGIAFGRDTGLAATSQARPRVAVTLGNASTYEGKLVDLEDKRVRLRLDEGATLVLPVAEVARLVVRSDKLLYLSDAKPLKVEQVPAIDRVWPWLVDKAPGGGPIELAGRQYPRGLVLIPRTRLTFHLAGQYDAFRAVVGIDDHSGPQANAVFRVYLDDKVVYDSGPVTHQSEPKSLDLPLGGAQALTLETDFGANFDFGDHCAFALARVVRK